MRVMCREILGRQSVTGSDSAYFLKSPFFFFPLSLESKNLKWPFFTPLNRTSRLISVVVLRNESALDLLPAAWLHTNEVVIQTELRSGLWAWTQIMTCKVCQVLVLPGSHLAWCRTDLWSSGRPAGRTSWSGSQDSDVLESGCFPHW